ncbi:MAG: hypothetical protein ACOVOV_01310 [Dolichospermum sp.]
MNIENYESQTTDQLKQRLQQIEEQEARIKAELEALHKLKAILDKQSK